MTNGVIEHKVWGTTQCVIAGPNFELHRIWAKAGGYCSRHRHATKSNLFFVESGRLQIFVADAIHVIAAGESLAVSPGTWHRFVAVENTVAYEVYYAVLHHDDIERDDTGGTQW